MNSTRSAGVRSKPCSWAADSWLTHASLPRLRSPARSRWCHVTGAPATRHTRGAAFRSRPSRTHRRTCALVVRTWPSGAQSWSSDSSPNCASAAATTRDHGRVGLASTSACGSHGDGTGTHSAPWSAHSRRLWPILVTKARCQGRDCRKRVILSSPIRSRFSGSSMPRPSAGARHSTPILPSASLRCTALAAAPTSVSG